MTMVYSTSGTAPLEISKHVAGAVSITAEDGSMQVYMAADIRAALNTEEDRDAVAKHAITVSE